MKINQIKKLFLAITSILYISNLNGQSTSSGPSTVAPNQPNTPGVDYLGWDNTVGVPLTIEHRAANQPIRFLNFDNNVGADIVATKMELTVGGDMIDDAGAALPDSYRD